MSSERLLSQRCDAALKMCYMFLVCALFSDGRCFAATLPRTGFMVLKKRALDSLDGDDFSMRKRALDYMDGDGFGFKKRALDNLEGDDFGGLSKRAASAFIRWPPVAIAAPLALQKRALDNLEGEGFDGFEKRALDSLEGDGFTGFNKRALDNLEGVGFDGFEKRALDNLEGEGFDEFEKRNAEKRALDILEGDSFGSFDKKKRTAVKTADDQKASGVDTSKSASMTAARTPTTIRVVTSLSKGAREARLRRAIAVLNRHRVDALSRRLYDESLGRVLKRSLDMLEGNDFGNF